MGREVVFGDGRYVFPSKKVATDRIREVLNEAALRTPLSGDELDFMLAVVAAHPDAADKIGSGVASIAVRQNPDRRTRGFWITRTDNSVIDFSYSKCLNGEHSHRHLVLEALRAGTQEQMKAKRIEWFAQCRDAGVEPRCVVTGRLLVMGPDAEVDHEDPTFVELAEQFLAIVGLESITTRPAPNGIGHVLNSDELLAGWQEFHRANARLRVIHWSANRPGGPRRNERRSA